MASTEKQHADYGRLALAHPAACRRCRAFVNATGRAGLFSADQAATTARHGVRKNPQVLHVFREAVFPRALKETWDLFQKSAKNTAPKQVVFDRFWDFF